MENELRVGAIVTKPAAIPIESLLRAQSIDGGMTRIEAVLDRHNLNAKTLARLANLAFGIGIKPEEISILGYVPDERDKFFAERFGFTILPIAHAALRDGKVEAWIGSTLVPLEHPLAKNYSKSSVLLSSEKSERNKRKIGVRSDSEIVSSYYVHFAVKDHPGVLAQVAQEFGDQEISIEKMLQPKPKEGSSETEIAFILHSCKTQDLDVAVNSISKLEVVVKTNVPLRILR